MAKIGRNEPCPCGSGNKYKKCCMNKEIADITQTAATEQQQQPTLSLRTEVEKTQQAAVDKKNSLYTLGVFIFFTTDSGDGWLLEISQMDALQVARNGKKIDVEIEENSETIEINWTHKFSIKDNKLFQVKDYKTKKTATYGDYPANRIAKAIKKARSRFPQEMLEQVHVQGDSAA